MCKSAAFVYVDPKGNWTEALPGDISMRERRTLKVSDIIWALTLVHTRRGSKAVFFGRRHAVDSGPNNSGE